MIQIKFKNLEKSDLVQNSTLEKVEAFVEKFPDLSESKIQVTLEMENSSLQPGPDLFKVKFHIVRGRYDGVTIEKSKPNLYAALAEVTDHLLEVLNRLGDKERVQARNKARKITY